MHLNQNNERPSDRQNQFLSGPLAWLTVIALGIGLWLLNGGTDSTPGILLLTGLVLVTLSLVSETALVMGQRKIPNVSIHSSIMPIIYGTGLAVVLLLIEHSMRYIGFPYPLDDGEGFVLNQAALLASGKPLYPPLGQSPFIVTNYPPVYPYILSQFINLSNISFFSGRLLSTLATLLLIVSSAGCVAKVTGNRASAWITALMVIASPVVYFWGSLVRVDIMAAAFGTTALWIAVSTSGFRVLWSAPLLLAAIYTRQSSVEAVFAIAAWLLIMKNLENKKISSGLKSGLALIALWTIGLIVIFLALQSWSHGQFLLHTITYTKTQFYPARIWSAFQWILPSHAIILLLALFALPTAFRDPNRRIFAFFFIASFATSLLSGKVGSDLNYYLNLITASSILAGLFAFDIFESAKLRNVPSWILIPAMLLIPAAIVQSGLIEGNRNYSFTPIHDDLVNGRHIVETLASARGPILSEDEGFCLLSGHEVLFNPFIMSELSGEGVWDETPFVNMIKNKEFDMIMLRFDVNDPNNDDRAGAGTNAGWDRFTIGMETAISDNYEIDHAVSPVFMRRYWFIYRPIPATQAPPTSEDSTRTDITNLLAPE